MTAPFDLVSFANGLLANATAPCPYGCADRADAESRCHPGSDAAEAVTAETITDEQIRDFVREHPRAAWMGGGPGKGTVNDASIILFSATTSYAGKMRIREEFARLIGARAV